MTQRLVTTPAKSVPLEALAFGGIGTAALAVSAENPLPVRAAPLPAGSTALVGSVAATALAGPFVPELGRPINLTLSGNWSGTAALLRSVDGGATKLPLTVAGAAWGTFIANCNEPVWEESEAGATFYLAFTRASGTLNYRVSQ